MTVYFVQNKIDYTIKIGYTSNMRKRMGVLNSQYGGIRLLGTMKGWKPLEKKLHKRFKLYKKGRHHSSEWFYPVEPLLLLIANYATPTYYDGVSFECRPLDASEIAVLTPAEIEIYTEVSA